MSDTVVNSQEDRKRNREGSNSEEMEEQKKEKKRKIQERRKKEKNRGKASQEGTKGAELHVDAFMYSKIKPSKKRCIMPSAQKSHSFYTKKMAQLITFALMKGIPIKDIIVKG